MARIVQQGIIQVAGSGETGVQVNEFEAAIKSVTTSTTVGAVFVYDTRNDSDGGAWRKKCAGLSWYDEALNQTTRGGRREFPSVALIVGDTNSTTTSRTLTIYDLDDPSMPMWMQFTCTASTWLGYLNLTSSGVNITSIYALNGRVYLGADTSANGGLLEINFADDSGGKRHSGLHKNFIEPISSRNSSVAVGANNSSGYIVDSGVNDVSATIVEGSEIGALGLPIPTVAVATNGGASVIHGGSGAVYNISSSSTHNDFHKIFFTDDNRVGVGFESNSTYDIASYVGLHAIPYANNTGVSSSAGWSELYNPNGYGGLVTATAAAAHTNSAVNAVVPTSEKGLAIGYPVGLAIVKRNAAKNTEGMVANIASDYTTGYQIGAAKGTWLTGGDATTTGRYDRSVGNIDLAEIGTVSHAAAETDAEVTKYYNFNNSNYFTQAYNSNLNFGTGDLSVMFWFKGAATASTEMFVSRATHATAGHRWWMFLDASQQIQFYLGDGSATGITSTAIASANWNQAVVMRKSGKMYIYVNGKSVATPVANTKNPDSGTSAILAVGTDAYGVGGNSYSGSLSLVRISATAPTPQQIKDIYEAEKPLFRAGAKCLLQSSSTVSDLAYDKGTDLLYVPTEAPGVAGGGNVFRGLESIDTLNSKATFGHSAADKILSNITAANGVVAVGSEAHAGVNLPAIDVRGDINTADTKLPDDGKLHFSGVTTDATQTKIGHIVIGENETLFVKAKVVGRNYVASDANAYFAEIHQTFRSDMDGTSAAQAVFSAPTYKMFEETGLPTGDVVLTVNDTNDTVEVKVTGAAGSGDDYRFIWNAEVEVQRISDKQYER